MHICSTSHQHRWPLLWFTVSGSIFQYANHSQKRVAAEMINWVNKHSITCNNLSHINNLYYNPRFSQGCVTSNWVTKYFKHVCDCSRVNLKSLQRITLKPNWIYCGCYVKIIMICHQKSKIDVDHEINVNWWLIVWTHSWLANHPHWKSIYCTIIFYTRDRCNYIYSIFGVAINWCVNLPFHHDSIKYTLSK